MRHRLMQTLQLACAAALFSGCADREFLDPYNGTRIRDWAIGKYAEKYDLNREQARDELRAKADPSWAKEWDSSWAEKEAPAGTDTHTVAETIPMAPEPDALTGGIPLPDVNITPQPNSASESANMYPEDTADGAGDFPAQLAR